MGSTALHTLWLLTAFTLTTQELVKLSVTPVITAECNQQVTLNCNVSSTQQKLSIRHMGWSQNKTPLCSVDSQEEITTHKRSGSDFYCEYKHGQLSLIFKSVQPMESGSSNRYMCKLQSIQGASHEYTTVELQECSGIVEDFYTNDHPACTFKRVYPDGDVHWFDGSHSLSHVKHNTTKQLAEGGWLTIHSYLERKSSNVPYNCSLKSTKSGRYIASTLVKNRETLIRFKPRPHGRTETDRNGVGSHGPMWTFLFISISLYVTQK